MCQTRAKRTGSLTRVPLSPEETRKNAKGLEWGMLRVVVAPQGVLLENFTCISFFSEGREEQASRRLPRGGVTAELGRQ